jgi:uncharacterized protein
METRAFPTPSGHVAVRLDPGEDLFGSLEKVAIEHDIRAGFVVSALGALEDAELGYFDGKEYQRKVLKGAHEVAGMPGSIARLDGKPHFHLHAVLGDPSHHAHAGHLHSARAGFLLEVLLEVLPGEFDRTPRGPLLKILRLYPPVLPPR